MPCHLATAQYVGDRRPRKTHHINYWNRTNLKSLTDFLFTLIIKNVLLYVSYSTPRGNRTLTNSRSRDFKSRASTYSAMGAYCGERVQGSLERQPALLLSLSIETPVLICLHHKPGEKENIRLLYERGNVPPYICYNLDSLPRADSNPAKHMGLEAMLVSV